MGVATLADLAAAAVLVHAHARSHVEALARRAPTNRLGEEYEVAKVAGAGQAWRIIHELLRQFRTATPGDRSVRGDLVAVRQLLRAARADDRQSPILTGQLTATLSGGVRAFTDIAAWNKQVLRHLMATRRLFIPGKSLTGEEVSDRPFLVSAKLHGRIVSPLRHRVNVLLDAYESARSENTCIRTRRPIAPVTTQGFTIRSPL